MDELEGLYGSSLSYGEKLTQREAIFTRSLENFKDLSKKFKTDRFARFGQRPLNNATILIAGLYHRRFDLFEAVLESKGGSIRDVLLFLEGLSKENDGLLDALEVRLQDDITPHT